MAHVALSNGHATRSRQGSRDPRARVSA